MKQKAKQGWQFHDWNDMQHEEREVTRPACADNPAPFHAAEVLIVTAGAGAQNRKQRHARILSAVAPALWACHGCPLLATCEPIEDYTGVVAGQAFDHGHAIPLQRRPA